MDFRENAMKSRQGKTSAEQTVDLMRLAEIVEQFRDKKVVLYGDFVADEFQYGDISRVSREARSEERRVGKEGRCGWSGENEDKREERDKVVCDVEGYEG